MKTLSAVAVSPTVAGSGGADTNLSDATAATTAGGLWNNKVKVKSALYKILQLKPPPSSTLRTCSCETCSPLTPAPGRGEYQVRREPPPVGESPSPSLTTKTSSSSIARQRTQFLALIPIYLLQLCSGLNTGFPAVLAAQLREACSEFSITTNQESWIVSMDNLATPFVCIASGYLQQKFGPKKILIAACIPYLCGWTFSSMASGVWAIYLSRLLVGTSNALVATTVYTVEITSKEMRGTYSLGESVVKCIGCLFSYILGSFLRWHQIAVYCHTIPVLAFIACIFVPESPVYLIKRKDTSKAESTLRKLYGSRFKVCEEVELIKESLETRRMSQSSQVHKRATIRSHPEVWQPFLIVTFLTLAQQFSGVTILRAYVVRLFDDVFNTKTTINATNITVLESNSSAINCSENATTFEAYLSAVIVALVRLAASLLLSRLLLRFKRRVLYFFSAGMTVAFLVVFSTSNLLLSTETKPTFPNDPISSSDVARWASLASACALVFSAQLGVQTLPTLLSGELFPSDFRALCKGFARAITCLFLLATLKIFPLLETSLGMSGTFYLLAVLMAATLPLTFLFLPETKDLGLETVRHYFTPSRTIFYLPLDLNAIEMRRAEASTATMLTTTEENEFEFSTRL